jgi:hypothetical protein
MLLGVLRLDAQQKDSLPPAWSLSTSAYYYNLPSENNTFTVITYADHKALHLEARYNYEDKETGSVFAGRRFEAGRAFALGITPMAGLIFGRTNGFAPGLELDATYKRFDFYSETEWVIDFEGDENNFLYTWGELGYSPLDAFRTGISYQRTKLYETEWDIQRGIFAEYQVKKFTAGMYYFNPFSSKNFLIASLSYDF